MRPHRPTRTVALILLIALAAGPVGPAAAARWMCALIEDVALREGPSLRFSSLRFLPLFTPLEVLGEPGTWTRVRDSDGLEGWVTTRHLGTVPTVVVTAERANVRAGPGARAKVLWTAERGHRFRLLRGRGRWYEVRDVYGESGWVHSSLVWGAPPPGPSPASPGTA